MAPHIMAHLELIAIIAEGMKRTEEGPFDGMLFVYRVPPKDDLLRWKERMMNSQIRWMTKELKGKYDPKTDDGLQVITATFDRLIRLAESPPPLQSP